MMYDLPISVEVCGVEYAIRSDYRAALDICAALSDIELNDQDKAFTALDIFYPCFSDMPEEHYDEAIKACFDFISCGDAHQDRKAPRLVDWEQDFKHIVSPINRVVGEEVRALEYMHWWSFISAYMEIGDCLFAQIVRIREKKAKGKPLDKSEKDFYRRNRHLVDFKTNYTQEENEVLNQWVRKAPPKDRGGA